MLATACVLVVMLRRLGAADVAFAALGGATAFFAGIHKFLIMDRTHLKNAFVVVAEIIFEMGSHVFMRPFYGIVIVYYVGYAMSLKR